MIKPVERWSGAAVERSNPTAEAKLRQTALQLEGLFVQRMFAAMRETVPQDGVLGQSSAEATFSAMLDEKFAEQVPAQWTGQHSLAEALYRQLRRRLEAPATDPPAQPVDGSTVRPFDRSSVPPDQR